MGSTCSTRTAVIENPDTQQRVVRGQDGQMVVQEGNPTGEMKQLPPMTKKELAAKRVEFWTTQTEGKQEMWQALQFSCNEKDAATQKTIMEASGLTPWVMGNLNAQSYDKWGFKYIVPIWCLQDPKNLLADGAKSSSSTKSTKKRKKRTAEQKRRDEEELTIKCRFSNAKPDIALSITGGTTFGELREHCAGERDEDPEHIVVFYCGRRCGMDERLTDVNVETGFIVQLYVQGPLKLPVDPALKKRK